MYTTNMITFYKHSLHTVPPQQVECTNSALYVSVQCFGVQKNVNAHTQTWNGKEQLVNNTSRIITQICLLFLLNKTYWPAHPDDPQGIRVSSVIEFSVCVFWQIF